MGPVGLLGGRRLRAKTVFDELESICPVTAVADRLGDLLLHHEKGNLAPEGMRNMPPGLLKQQLTILLTYVTSGPTDSQLLGQRRILHTQYPPTKMVSSSDRLVLASAFKDVLLELGAKEERIQFLSDAFQKGLAT